MECFPQNLLERYGKSSVKGVKIYAAFGITQLVCKIIQFILTCIFLTSFDEVTNITADQRCAIWLGSIFPIEGVFEYTVLNALWSHLTNGVYGSVSGYLFIFTILLKCICAFFIYYDVLKEISKDFYLHSFGERKILCNAYFTYWTAVGGWLVIWVIVGSMGMAGSISSEFDENRDPYNCKNLAYEDRGNACENKCETDSELYAWSVFLSFTVFMIIFPIEMIIDGAYDKCPDAPLFPTIWAFVIAAICLVIYVSICICCCCSGSEPVDIARVGGETGKKRRDVKDMSLVKIIHDTVSEP